MSMTPLLPAGPVSDRVPRQSEVSQPTPPYTNCRRTTCACQLQRCAGAGAVVSRGSTANVELCATMSLSLGQPCWTVNAKAGSIYLLIPQLIALQGLRDRTLSTPCLRYGVGHQDQRPGQGHQQAKAPRTVAGLLQTMATHLVVDNFLTGLCPDWIRLRLGIWRPQRDMPDLFGKCYIVTGGNSGVGFQASWRGHVVTAPAHGSHVCAPVFPYLAVLGHAPCLPLWPSASSQQWPKQ